MVGAYLRWALIGEWALINFLGFQAGRLFEVGAYLKVGSLSNKYGMCVHKGKNKKEG